MVIKTPECVILTYTQSQIKCLLENNHSLLNMQQTDVKSLLSAEATLTPLFTSHFMDKHGVFHFYRDLRRENRSLSGLPISDVHEAIQLRVYVRERDNGFPQNSYLADNSPAKTSRSPTVVLMCDQRQRLWASLETTLGQRFVFAAKVILHASQQT